MTNPEQKLNNVFRRSTTKVILYSYNSKWYLPILVIVISFNFFVDTFLHHLPRALFLPKLKLFLFVLLSEGLSDTI